jgi:PAT family beta-lactamase induction signal transducer AmpG
MIAKIKNSYLDKRILFIFLNGIASGFPWVIIGSAMTLWLKDAGLTRSAIGFFGSIFFVYSINWLWAPLLDKVKLPLTKTLGRRKSWLIILQLLLFVLTLLLFLTDPKISIAWVSLLALLIAFTSATQDIVIDAYRIDVIADNEEDKISSASAATTSGWWVGFGFLGAIAFYVADVLSWNSTYFVMSLFFLIFALNTLVMPKESEKTKESQEFKSNLLNTFISPIKEFFSRLGWIALLIIIFVMFFKIGEAFLGKMSLVFYSEIGFSKSDIATYQKLFGSTITIIFSIIASFISIKYGLLRGLLIGGVAMAATNLLYSYLSIIGADTNFLILTLFLDNFTSAFSTVAFVAFISSLVNKAYSATQYAALASLGNLGKTLFAASSGLLIDGLAGDWFIFFIITALMVLPSLIILIIIGKKLKNIIN